MKKLIVLAVVMMLAGCATTSQPPEGMRSTQNIPIPMTESMQGMFKSLINQYGLDCARVTDLGDVALEKNAIITKAQCDGQIYKITTTRDGQWFSIVKTADPISQSMEALYQRVIYGNGFKCSDVTDIYGIKESSIFKVTCIEGTYKVVRDGMTFVSVSQW